MSRTESYLDDVPMRLSRKFEPIHIDVDTLPELRSSDSLMREFTYDFAAELCSLEAADRRSAEICAEAERVRQKQVKQHEVSLNHHLQRHAHQPPPPPSSLSLTELMSQRLAVMPVSASLTPAAPSHSPVSTSAVPVTPGPSVFPVYSSSSSNESAIAVPTVMNVTNGGSSAMTPVPSDQSQVGVCNGGQRQQPEAPALRPLKPINTKEFEDFVGSSPFDDALLKSIDDKQELNSVFANVHPANNGSSTTSSSSPHNYHGPNHSPYTNFNPT